MSKLKYDKSKKANIFNADGETDPTAGLKDTLAAKTGGGKSQLYTSTMPDDPSRGVSVHDNVNDVTVSFTPKVSLLGGRGEDGHVVYPLKDDPGQMIFTPKGNGVKEDIVLTSAPDGDVKEYSYHLGVPDYVQPRLNQDGSVGFYTADPQFFGNISYGSDKDRALIDKVRVNNPKNNLMFSIPAPEVRGPHGVEPVKAHFGLRGDELTVHVSGLASAAYPLSIDPTFVLSSTADFVTGSVDDNIDLSQANQIGRATLSGGSIPSWTASAFNTANPTFAGSLVAYNGFLYLIGGVAGAAGSTTNNVVEYNPIDLTTGATTGWTASANTLKTGRQGLVGFGYNGYLYAIGGESTSAVPITAASAHTVEYAPINSDGTPGVWNYATGQLAFARSYAAGASYRGYLYVMGGSAGTLNASQRNDYEYAQISGTGDIASWTTGGNTFTTARSRFSGAAYNGFVYIAGGLSGVGTTPALNNDIQYAPITSNGSLGTWATTNAFPTARRNQGIAVNNGYIYVYAGCNQAAMACPVGNMLADTQYAVINADGTIGQWQQTLNYNHTTGSTREPGGSAFYSNHLYFVAGCNAEGVATGNTCATPLQLTFYSSLDPVGRYDLGVPQLQTTEPYNNNGLTEAKAGGSSVALNGFLYYLGGCSVSNCTAFDSVVEYATLNADGTVGAFTATTALPDGSGLGGGRMGASVVAYNDKLYVIGGVQTNTFPPVLSVTGTTVAPGTGGTHNINMPATVASGDLLITIINVPGGSAVTMNAPAGWTQLTGSPFNNGTTAKVSVFAKNAAGTEGGTQVNFATGVTGDAAAQVYRIPAGDWNAGTLTSVVTATAAAATGVTTPDPPSVTPAWGAANTLWIAAAGGETWTGLTSPPAGFTSEGIQTVGATTTGASVASAILSSNVATENPGTFTLATSSTGEALTIAVQPSTTGTTYQSSIVSNTQNSNGTLNSWAAEANSLPAARAFSTAQVWHNWIYVMGGIVDGATAPSTLIYHAQIASNAPGTWTATTHALTTGRFAASGGIWGNWLYIIGGQGVALSTGTYVAAANGIEQLTILDSGDITAASSTQNPTGQFLRRLMGGFVHNGVIYTFGGETSGSTNPVVTIDWANLNAATGAVGAWSALNIGNSANAGAVGLQTARSLTTAVDYGGNLYVIGGCTSTLAATSFTACTTFVSIATSIEANLVNNGGTGQTNAFASATALSTATADHAVVAYNGFLYQLGGCTAYTTGVCSTWSSVVNAAPINPGGALGAWTTTGMTALPAATSLEQAVAYNGYMYVMGGSVSGTAATTNVWFAAISNTGTIGTWQTSTNGVPQLTVGLNRFGAAIANGYLYVIGGANNAGTLQTAGYSAQIDTVNGTLGAWTTLGTSLPTAVAGFNLISYNGYLYVVGGCSAYTSNACTTTVQSIQFGATNGSGVIASWNFTTDVPQSMVARQAVASNGYMYFIGNETDVNEISYVDINGNGTLGLLQDSQPALAGGHAHGAAAIFDGFLYTTGGCTLSAGVCTTVSTSDEYAGQQAIARVGHYSKLFNTQVDTAPSQMVVDGSLSGPGSTVATSFYSQATGASTLGVAQVFNPTIFGNFYVVQSLDSSGVNVGIAFNYLIQITLDDSGSGTFPDSTTQTIVQDITVFYHANPSRRLRHGASFTNTGCQGIQTNGCILDTAP